MQLLLGDKASAIDATFLQELFLQCLPTNVRMVLASADTKELDAMAQLADKIMEVAAPSVSSVTVLPEVVQLRGEIADLRKLVESLVVDKRTSTTRRRTPSRSHSHPSSPSSTASDICWYHQRFGTAAHKCTPPCLYSENSQASH